MSVRGGSICAHCFHFPLRYSSLSNALYLLVSVSQRLMFAQESGGLSYLDETLKKALIFIRRLFDKFIVSTWDYYTPRPSEYLSATCIYSGS